MALGRVSEPRHVPTLSGMMSTIEGPLSLCQIHHLSHATVLLESHKLEDAKLARDERLWVCSAATPQRLRLLFLVNRSTQHAQKVMARHMSEFDISDAGCSVDMAVI
jgi:hypothetical protein